jgi:hypothetical protein
LPLFSSTTSSASTPELGLEHGVAARGEGAGAEGAHRLLVLDQQNDGAAGEIGGLLSWPASFFTGSSSAAGDMAGQQDGE